MALNHLANIVKVSSLSSSFTLVDLIDLALLLDYDLFKVLVDLIDLNSLSFDLLNFVKDHCI